LPTANPINIARIDHVVLRVRDLDRSLRFYIDVLGCKLERGPGDNGLAQLRSGDGLIDLVDVDAPLGKAGGDPPERRAPNLDHVCLQIVPWNAEDILAHLDAHGVEHGGVESRYGALGMGPSIYLQDPEGNTVELKAGVR